MKQLRIRFATPDDSSQIVEWLNRTPSNDFDPDILKYPTLRVFCSYNGEPVSYLPTHKAMILESLANNPDASEEDIAQAIRDMVKAAQLVASGEKIKELYFVVSDERVATIAKNHNFEEKKCMRLKL